MALPFRLSGDFGREFGYRDPMDREDRRRGQDGAAPPPEPAPPPIDFDTGDFDTGDGGTTPEPLPAPAPPPASFPGPMQPASINAPGVPPPPPPRANLGAAGSGLEGTFTQPGTRGAAPFRTAEYFQGRFTAPRAARLGAGSPVGVQGSMTDLSGGMDEAFGDSDELRRRLIAAISGGGR